MALGSGRNAAESVPYGVRVAAAWSWRAVIIVGAVGLAIWLLQHVSLLVIPLMIAALLSGLLGPVVAVLQRWRVPRGLSVGLAIVGSIAALTLILSLVGRTLASGFRQLWAQALEGLAEVERWIFQGPLQLNTVDVASILDEALKQLQANSSQILSGALSWGSTIGHVIAGLLLTLFALIFFLMDGRGIWRFLLGLLPRGARGPVDGAGQRGWKSLVSYVRVQLFVAFVDAAGIGLGAAILGVPLALPLGVLVFLGSFIPILGALVTGAVAVLLALVANGWLNAIIMLIVVLAVQQAESHILQPLVMGKAVSLHPLAVVLAVAGGSMLAGIAGALFAVPMLAVANAFVRHLVDTLGERGPTLAAAAGEPGTPGEERAGPDVPASYPELSAPADTDGEDPETSDDPAEEKR